VLVHSVQLLMIRSLMPPLPRRAVSRSTSYFEKERWGTSD
jgi:hypothetical protein